jgi:hypothetical protein
MNRYIESNYFRIQAISHVGDGRGDRRTRSVSR